LYIYIYVYISHSFKLPHFSYLSQHTQTKMWYLLKYLKLDSYCCIVVEAKTTSYKKISSTDIYTRYAKRATSCSKP
ncbi:MAG: hypothetical protein ACKPKO_35785, partial [Candidatus Fonsibacter sp.]